MTFVLKQKLEEKLKFFEIGQQIELEIVAITDDTIFLDMNAKSEGVLDASELLDKDGKMTVKTGDKIKCFFVGTQNGEMRFTTKIAGDKADKTMLENAYKNRIPVEGTVEKEIKGGYEVKIGSARAFCPYSQMGFKEKQASSYYVGKHLVFKITQYTEDGRNILVSNRSVLEDKYNEEINQLSQQLAVGQIVAGKITSIQNYGAFIDIRGFQALLPVSEISRGHVDDINSVIKTGDEVTVKIIKADWDHEKVSVSLKALMADPWDSVQERYTIGQKVSGKISRIADFGLFINLEDGIDGLLHASELENIDRNTNLKKVFKTGTPMTVIIKAIDKTNKRISLQSTQTKEQDEVTSKYLDEQDDSGDTYNPFAALLKKK